MKKKYAVLALLALCGAMSFAAGKKDAAPPTPAPAPAPAATAIRWAYWGSGVRVTISQEAIDLFQRKNPGFTVNPEVSGGTGDHFTKVDTQIAGGNGPDIIQMGGNLPDYVKKGVLLPLEKYAGGALNAAAIDRGAIESGTIDGHLYGVSTGGTMPAMVYNKSMLERAGAPLPKTSMTYAEFRDYLVKLKALLPKGTYPMMDVGSTSSGSFPFGYWTRYNGTPLYDAVANASAVKAADAQKYLELFKDYRDNGLVPPADVAAGFAETNADTSALIAGKVAIDVIWTNALGNYQAATTDDLGLIEFPGAAETKALWSAPSQFYTVNKDSKNPEAAVKFIDFLVNDPDAAKILGSNRGASASSTARASGASDKNDAKILAYMNAAGPHSSKETAHLPNDTEFNSTLYLIYQKVAFGQLTPAQGGQQIQDLISRMIKK